MLQVDLGQVEQGGGELRECRVLVDGMTCQSCVNLIEDTLPRKLSSITSVNVSCACYGRLLYYSVYRN